MLLTCVNNDRIFSRQMTQAEGSVYWHFHRRQQKENRTFLLSILSQNRHNVRPPSLKKKLNIETDIQKSIIIKIINFVILSFLFSSSSNRVGRQYWIIAESTKTYILRVSRGIYFPLTYNIWLLHLEFSLHEMSCLHTIQEIKFSMLRLSIFCFAIPYTE